MRASTFLCGLICAFGAATARAEDTPFVPTLFATIHFGGAADTPHAVGQHEALDARPRRSAGERVATALAITAVSLAASAVVVKYVYDQADWEWDPFDSADDDPGSHGGSPDDGGSGNDSDGGDGEDNGTVCAGAIVDEVCI
jgi:hypothetical protein